MNQQSSFRCLIGNTNEIVPIYPYRSCNPLVIVLLDFVHSDFAVGDRLLEVQSIPELKLGTQIASRPYYLYHMFRF